MHLPLTAALPFTLLLAALLLPLAAHAQPLPAEVTVNTRTLQSVIQQLQAVQLTVQDLQDQATASVQQQARTAAQKAPVPSAPGVAPDAPVGVSKP